MIETQIIVKIVKFETANLCFDRKQICGFFLISVQISPSDDRPDDRDDAWTSNLTTKQMNDIRLHLSWELGMDTFGWSREKVAESIVSRYKKLGVFLFLKHVVVTDLTRNTR